MAFATSTPLVSLSPSTPLPRSRARPFCPVATLSPLSRRTVLTAAALSALAPALPSFAAVEPPTTTTAVDTSVYTFAVPATGFARSVASLSGGRIVTVFVSDGDGDSNVSMVQTPIQGDFQKLTSFGSLETVLKTIVPEAVAGNKVIKVQQSPKNNAYIIEYQLKPAGDVPLRHLVTVFSLQPGRYLCTLTVQAQEDNWNSQEAGFRNVVESYKLKLRD